MCKNIHEKKQFMFLTVTFLRNKMTSAAIVTLDLRSIIMYREWIIKPLQAGITFAFTIQSSGK